MNWGKAGLSLKVVHVCSSPSWGGMEMIVARLALLQKKAGYEVSVVSARDAALSAKCRELGLNCHVIPGIKYWPIAFPGFVAKMKEQAPDIIHVHYSKDLNLAIPAKKIISGRVVFTKHIGSYITKKDPWHRFIYANVDKATAISQLIKKNLLETTPLSDDKTNIVYLGTDTEKFRPDTNRKSFLRKELDLPAGTLLIGMMGRMSYGKGYEDFIEMAVTLKSKNGKFVFIGGHSKNEDAYGKKIEDYIKRELGESAHLTGFREDRERYLQALDIFVFPSYAESFGLALTEAMACGLPCAAYGKDGVLDIIDDHRDGLLAEARNVKDLADRVNELISDKPLREKLGLAARNKIIDRFSDQKMLQGFEWTYQEALGAV